MIDRLARNLTALALPSDTVGSSTWTGNRVVDALCPPLSESGNPVTCYPVGGTPLGVTARWEPQQTGSGDPSPENIRSIVGRDAIKVERCGVNLIDAPDYIDTSVGIVRVDLNNRLQKNYSGQYTLAARVVSDDTSHKFGIRVIYSDGTLEYLWLKDNATIRHSVSTNASKTAKNIEFAFDTVFTLSVYDVMLVTGDTAPSEYQPYTGQTITLKLPQTIYGGSVDAVTGEGRREWELLTLDGDKMKATGSASSIYYNFPQNVTSKIEESSLLPSSHFPSYIFKLNPKYNFIFCMQDQLLKFGFNTVDDFNSYLAAQYAAGTPVQVAYKLADSVPFTATGAQSISALSGTNTVLTDADTLTVAGKSDPVHLIKSMQDAVASIQEV